MKQLIQIILLIGLLCLFVFVAGNTIISMYQRDTPEAVVVEVVVEAESLGYDLKHVTLQAEAHRLSIIQEFMQADHAARLDLVIPISAILGCDFWPHGLESGDRDAVLRWFESAQAALSDVLLEMYIHEAQRKAGVKPKHDLILPNRPTFICLSRKKDAFWEGNLDVRILLCSEISRDIGRPLPVGWTGYDQEATIRWFLEMLPDMEEYYLAYFTQLRIQIVEEDTNR